MTNTGDTVPILKEATVLWKKTDKCIHNQSNTYYGLREQYRHNAKEAQKGTTL